MLSIAEGVIFHTRHGLGRSATALVGIEMIAISRALAALTTETGVAPIPPANAVKLSAPLEFAIET
jgi:hypothetical protein